jgi:hypothetical protein
LQAVPIGSEDRVAVIRERVEIEDWPSDANLRGHSHECHDRRLKIFDRESGVDVIEAIAASCAVPFVWPAVMIQGHPYFDAESARPRMPTRCSSGCGRRHRADPDEHPAPPQTSRPNLTAPVSRDER